MAIIVDKSTRLVVQNLTGREGSFHALRNRAYGTQVVAGAAPGHGGEDVEGIPVFNTVSEAVAETRRVAFVLRRTDRTWHVSAIRLLRDDPARNGSQSRRRQLRLLERSSRLL